MKYWYQKPHPTLSAYVRTVLILDGSLPPGTVKQPLFTNMPALVCRTEKDDVGIQNISQLTLYGKTTPSTCWEMQGNTTIIAYFFNPFALASIFNLSASQLINEAVDLSHWNAHQANALKTQLIYAASTAGKIDVLNDLLIHQLEENRKECEIIQYATDHIMNNSGTEVLSTILEKLNLNERTFQRIFKKYVGITPSHYRRICQFQLSFSQLRAKEFESLSDVAFDNGFADQSHFIRSFKEFTETTPNHYLKSGLKKKNP